MRSWLTLHSCCNCNIKVTPMKRFTSLEHTIFSPELLSRALPLSPTSSTKQTQTPFPRLLSPAHVYPANFRLNAQSVAGPYHSMLWGGGSREGMAMDIFPLG